jgi:phosphatidylserine decarboxylase
MADRAVGIPVVREGLPFVAATGAAAAVATAAGWVWLGACLGGVTFFTAWFFRNPKRTVPVVNGAVVSPGDGRVIAIEEEFEQRYLKEKSTRVSIFLNVFNVHVNRIPCSGIVEAVAYQPGRFVAANRPDATLKNEQNALMIRTVEGAKVLCVQVAGLIARRIVCWASPGERVQRGDRYGLIRFGSRMDMFLPTSAKLQVKVGEHVKGGETILALLPDRT